MCPDPGRKGPTRPVSPESYKRVLDASRKATEAVRRNRRYPTMANVRLHITRLVRTPSWAWHPERHDDGCRYAALLRAVGL